MNAILLFLEELGEKIMPFHMRYFSLCPFLVDLGSLSMKKRACVTRFFYNQPSCYGSNVTVGLKVKQIAKQPSTLKTLLQKILVKV